MIGGPPEQSIDGVLLLSFGGPEGPDDVIPFLERVTAGRNIPAERLAVVASQYDTVGGVSPLNDQCRRLQHELRKELRNRGRDIEVYWGNRNWAPYVKNTVATMTANGVRSAAAITTSAYCSYSACRQYLDDIESARGDVGVDAPVITKVRPYFNHPRFIKSFADSTRAALGRLACSDPTTPIIFTAHSIPLSMATTSDYEAQLHEAAALVAALVGPASRPWTLVWQSRSGPPSVPWLEPDINDEIRRLRQTGERDAVIVPIGFTSDHMEVVFDLDIQVAQTAAAVGLKIERATTPGTTPDPEFVAMMADLIDEQLLEARPVALGALGVRPTPCAKGCCPAPTATR